MKVKAKDLKKGDKVSLLGKEYIVDTIELSDIGKQGVKKCRLILLDQKLEKMALVRPEDYPFEKI